MVFMQTIVEMPEFLRCAKRLGISQDERESIIDVIAANPHVGDEIAGTGGMRKIRIAAKGKGKSGGYRLITFFSGTEMPVFLITIYGKSQKDSVTDKEKNLMKTLADAIVRTYRRQ